MGSCAGVTVEEARPQVPELGWDIQEALLSRLTPKQVARLSRTSRAWRNYSDKRWEEERQRLVDAYFEREPLAHRTLECVARASVGLDVVTGQQLEYDFVWHQRHVRVDEGSDVLDFTQQASMVFGVRHTHLRLYCYAPKRPCWCTNQPRLITLSWKEGKLVSIWGSLNAAEIEYLAGFFIKVEELSIRGKPAGGGIKARPVSSRGFRAIRKWWFL